MRKSIRFVIIAMIVLAFGAAGTVTACAAASAGAGQAGGFGTLKQHEKVIPGGSRYMPNAAIVTFRTSKGLTEKNTKKALVAGDGGAEDIRVEEVLNFKTEPEMTDAENGGRKMLQAGGISNLSVALVRSKTLSTEQLVKKLNARRDVLRAEPNYRVYACGVNDPFFSSQWSMRGGAAGTPAYSSVTPNVTSVWDQGTTGSDRIVAILDTGVDYTHPDLENRMWHNTHYPALKGECGYDFVGGDGDPMDENGHGTHCAGIMGAQANNGIGISGVNQDIRIMALRTLDADGSSWLYHEVAAYNYISRALDLGEPIQAVNNSWSMGSEYSETLHQVMDVVGGKGAVSVIAAGNNGADCDEDPDYPSCIDSPYIISTAATTEAGGLVSFSNYGKETVDVAAPGTDILSTVIEDTYNPTIYGAEQDRYSARFNDYESEGGWESVSDLAADLYLNGEKYTGGETQKISLTKSSEGFNMAGENTSGHSLQLEAKNLKARDLICIPIPYDISRETQTAPSFSAMVRADRSNGGYSILGAVDMPRESDLGIDTIEQMYLKAGMNILKDDFDNWTHLSFQTLDEDELEDVKRTAADGREEPDPMKREVVLLIYAESSGNISVGIDDMGLSRQDLPGTEVFGRYDFMSGTSMAAPFITGSTALYAAALSPSFQDDDAEALASEVISMSREGDLPIVQKGSFDFTKKPAQLGPRISGVRVDKARGTITINGTGLSPVGAELTVEIGPNREKLQQAQILERSGTSVVVKDEGWINNVETIRITGYGGKVSVRSDLYMVGGKKGYARVTNAEAEIPGEAMATDGRYIYMADSAGNTIWKMDTKKLTGGMKELGKVNPESCFGKVKNDLATTAMKFGRDLVWMNGKLYTVIEYGEADEMDPEYEEIWFYGKGAAGLTGMEAEDEEDEEEGEMSIYAGAFRLISMDAKTGAVKNLGRLPADLDNMEDYAMAAYNGKLCFIGGYSYGGGSAPAGLRGSMKIFDPSKKSGKRWSDGASLPQARAGGKALQVGTRLIYTLGYEKPVTEGGDYPANLIYDGKGWKVSGAPQSGSIHPLWDDETVVRGGKTYLVPYASVGVVKNGLVYMGMPAEDFGDTFLYNVPKDTYTDSGYNFISNLDEEELLQGIAVGSKLYGFDGEEIYTAKMDGSGLMKITVRKSKGGEVSGRTAVPAGTNAVFTVKAKKGFRIKSIKAGGRTVKVKNPDRQSVTIKRVTKTQSLQVKFSRK